LENENKNSNRRRFIRKLVKLGAAGGIAGLLLGQLEEKKGLPPKVQAVLTPLYIDYVNTGTGTTELDSSGGGTTLYAKGTATTGTVRGVKGEMASGTYGMGVEGWALPTGGQQTYGVFGGSNSTNGTGVFGGAYASSGTPIGVSGYAPSTGGSGGIGVNGSGGGIGVLGQAGSTGAKPIVARGYYAGGQTANLQEWQNSAGTPLSVVDANGKLGVGIAAPARQVHLQGNNAVFRMDRDANSSAFILVRTAPGDFSTIWKTFYVGVDASGVNNGSFFIGDVGTAVSGPSIKRLFIDNTGRVGIGTESPTQLLHVAGRVKATGYDTGDIKFTNNFTVTEDEKAGLAFKNDAGEKIALLDAQGNLHIKGDLIKDL